MRWLALLLLLLLTQPGQALAHAALLEASPTDGATLTQAPGTIRLRFDEPVGLIGLSLTGPAGAVTPLVAPVAENDVVTATFPGGVASGTYLLSWRVTSADSHPVAGTIVFGVGVAPALVTTGETSPARWLVPSLVVRAAFLTLLAVAAGGAMFRMVLAPQTRMDARALRLVRWAAWLGIGLAAVQIGLRGALLADTPEVGPFSAEAWRLGLGATLAQSLVVSAIGLAACALTRGRWAGALAGAVAMGGLVLSGHAGTAEPRALMATALVAHGVAAAFWVGAFIPLLGALRGRGGALPLLKRFSTLATAGVVVLIASGVAMAVVQLGSVAALTGSTYGRTLMVKLGLVAALLALAALNRSWLTPAFASDPARPGRLRASIAAELALATAVLAATSVLGLTPPPRAEARPVEHAAYMETDGIPAVIAITPGRTGRNRITLTVGRAAQPLEVMLDLHQAAAGVEAVRRPMRLIDGEWVYEGPDLALPGRWTIKAEALTTAFTQTNFITEMDIK